jgi:hypothetical protein
MLRTGSALVVLVALVTSARLAAGPSTSSAPSLPAGPQDRLDSRKIIESLQEVAKVSKEAADFAVQLAAVLKKNNIAIPAELDRKAPPPPVLPLVREDMEKYINPMSGLIDAFAYAPTKMESPDLEAIRTELLSCVARTCPDATWRLAAARRNADRLHWMLDADKQAPAIAEDARQAVVATIDADTRGKEGLLETLLGVQLKVVALQVAGLKQMYPEDPSPREVRKAVVAWDKVLADLVRQDSPDDVKETIKSCRDELAKSLNDKAVAKAAEALALTRQADKALAAFIAALNAGDNEALRKMLIPSIRDKFTGAEALVAQLVGEGARDLRARVRYLSAQEGKSFTANLVIAWKDKGGQLRKDEKSLPFTQTDAGLLVGRP